MNAEQPGKRLVGWKQYLHTKLAKGWGYSSAVVATGLSAALFVVGCLTIWESLRAQNPVYDPFVRAGILVAGVGFGVGAIGALWYAGSLCVSAYRIDPVTLITRHNTGDLPEVESLVRSSAPPAIDSKSELLRPLEPNAEKSPEQLLRAAPDSSERPGR